MRLFYHRKWVHVSTAMMGTVRLFYHYKWAHVSAIRTSNRTSSLQVSMFPPTVGPCPEVVHGVIYLSPYISHHFYLFNYLFPITPYHSTYTQLILAEAPSFSFRTSC